MGVFMRVSQQKSKQTILDGAEARKRNASKLSCPYSHECLELKHLWLAGWHDEDIGRP